jgi:hypothetical protein
LFNALQEPFPEQTVKLVEFLPKQLGNSHWFPEYPLTQLQTFKESHEPFPEQTLGSVEFLKKVYF